MHSCRFCSASTVRVADFGTMPIANNFVSSPDLDRYRFQLTAAFCEECSLFQLEKQPEPSMMFHAEYPFFTGLSSAMSEHFRKMLIDSLGDVQKSVSEAFVVEIGSNDGTLLSNLVPMGIRHLGIDPSSNVVELSKAKGVEAVVEFFNLKTATKVLESHGKADLILAANVICHIPNLKDFAEAISLLLDENGRFIFEEPYAGDVLEKTSYDQFYDEHVYIFSCISVSNIFGKYGLELVDAIHQDTHGGSMRYVLAPKGSRKVSNRVVDLLKSEISQGLAKSDVYLEFGLNCILRKAELKNLLNSLKSAGKSIAGYAATSKSTTVLNFCDIGPELISYISDSTPEKQGRLTPGKYIPVVNPEEMRLARPDYLVLFAWNHEREVLAKEKELTDSGTKWIRFVPKVEILDFNGKI
jgi:methylation protein EvaC